MVSEPLAPGMLSRSRFRVKRLNQLPRVSYTPDFCRWPQMCSRRLLKARAHHAQSPPSHAASLRAAMMRWLATCWPALVSLLADGQDGRCPNFTATQGARLPFFSIVNSRTRLRKALAFIQCTDHQCGIGLVVRRIGHESGDVDPALSADQELDGPHRELVAAEQVSVVDRDAQRAIRI